MSMLHTLFTTSPLYHPTKNQVTDVVSMFQDIAPGAKEFKDEPHVLYTLRGAYEFLSVPANRLNSESTRTYNVLTNALVACGGDWSLLDRCVPECLRSSVAQSHTRVRLRCVGLASPSLRASLHCSRNSHPHPNPGPFLHLGPP